MRRRLKFPRQIEVERILDLGKFGVLSLAWLSEGDRLAVEQGGDLVVVSASDGERLEVFEHPEYRGRFGSVGSHRWSPDGKKLLQESISTFRVFDLDAGTFGSAFEGHSDRIQDLRWSPSGQGIASASADGFAATWDPSTRSIASTFEGHEGGVDRVCWSNDELSIATFSRADKSVRVWDVATGAEQIRIEQPYAATDFVWEPESDALWVHSDDGALRRFPRGGAPGVELPLPWAGRNQIGFIAGSEFLLQASVGYERARMRIWSYESRIVRSMTDFDYNRVSSHAHDGEFALHPRDPRVAMIVGYSEVYLLNVGAEVRGESRSESLESAEAGESTEPGPTITIVTGVASDPGTLSDPGQRSSGSPVWIEEKKPVHDGSGPMFDVFLCHNSQDKPHVRILDKQLRDRGISTWLDERELQPGLPWQDALQEQIATIGAAAVLVGTQGFGPWQNRELSGFLSQFNRRGCPVIPVILDVCRETPDLPIFLQEMTWVDFRLAEPNPLDRLVWGITGRRGEA